MKKVLKIVGILIASCVVLGVVGFVVSVVLSLSGIGNPIVRYTASKRINDYIEEAYPNNDFDEINVRYNFKFNVYGTGVSSKSSEDTHFYISYDDGEIQDSYDEYVTSGRNTFDRICKQFDDYVEDILADEDGDEVELCIYDIYSSKSKDDSFDTIVNSVPLDGQMDIHALADFDVAPEITVWYISNDMSFEKLAKKFKETKAIMEEKRIPVDVYSISLRFPEEMREGRRDEELCVYDFPVEFIDSDEFMQKLVEYDKAGRQIYK